jgi:uncharacterized membrane protein YgdD (TMEM256/DUF423 family)
MRRGWGISAAAFGASAVALGAFGAHALRGRLDEATLALWRTAVDYQFWHALALLALAGFAPATRLWRASGIALCVGTLLFCGSLYALALGAPHWVGVLTPLGGLSLMVGWILLGSAFWCSAASK